MKWEAKNQKVLVGVDPTQVFARLQNSAIVSRPKCTTRSEQKLLAHLKCHLPILTQWKIYQTMPIFLGQCSKTWRWLMKFIFHRKVTLKKRKINLCKLRTNQIQLHLKAVSSNGIVLSRLELRRSILNLKISMSKISSNWLKPRIRTSASTVGLTSNLCSVNFKTTKPINILNRIKHKKANKKTRRTHLRSFTKYSTWTWMMTRQRETK